MRLGRVSRYWIILLLAVILAKSAVSKDLYISPTGSDFNIGSIAEPFKSMTKARDVIRENNWNKTEAVTVFLREGTHYLSQPVKFSSEDSGNAKYPVTYTAYSGEKVIISGGMKLILKWEPYRDGIWQTQTPENVNIDQLFVNGQRQHMARYPNYDVNARPYNGAAADAFSPSRASRWEDPAGGYIHAMHRAHWGGYHYQITGKNENNEVTYKGGWQNNRQMGMHPNDRMVENIFEELDVPQEWFHDTKNHILYYYPPKEVDVKMACFEIAQLNHLIEFQGSQQRSVRYIILKGLTFSHASRTFMETKEPLLRSDWTIYRGGGVLFNGAEDCTLTDCEFNQLGGNSIFVNKYNRRIAIRGCHIYGSGASGICFVGSPKSVRNPLFEYGQQQQYKDIDKTPGPKTDDYPADCLVYDCLIHSIGVVEKQATGVQISMAKGITVSHCSIYDVGRAGINISEGTFGGHLIEYCDVFDTVRETGDHGSFNSWGRDRFWHLKGGADEELPRLALLDVEKNVIRNSRWRCDHGWDIDLDDGSSNYHVYNNLCLNGGIKLREGFHRICENNIMVNNSFHPHVWYKNSQDVFRKNIVFTPYKPIRVPTPWGKQCDYNLLHNSGIVETQTAENLQQQSKLDGNSIIANAMFINPENGDYRVADDSPAIQLGFKNFPMDQFGVRKPDLKAMARTPVFPVIKETVKKTEGDAVSYWQGATVKSLSGEEFSAFGVRKEDGGIQLKQVPAGTFAANSGFKANDLIQTLNDHSVKTVADFQRATDLAGGKALTINYVRGQKSRTIIMKKYVYVLSESTNTQFKHLQFLPDDKVLEFKNVTATPQTANEPLEILSDGKLAENYGPVFRNGVVDGTYRVDLGNNVDVSVISTWSFNQGGNRGNQKLTLFGISEKNIVPKGKKDRTRVPIALVDTTGGPVGKYVASRVQVGNGESLGRFRWIEWVVQPITNQKENTAFQEFQVR